MMISPAVVARQAKRKRSQSLGETGGRCRLSVSTMRDGEIASYNLNQGGWAAAHRTARNEANASARPLALVDLVCGPGLRQGGSRLALYQCGMVPDRGRVSCVIEEVANPDEAVRPSIAGLFGLGRR